MRANRSSIVHDFAVEPQTHVFGENAIATASVSETSPGFYEVEIALPAAAWFAIWSDPEPTANFALTDGEIVATAGVPGPTLGTAVPIAVGLVLVAIGGMGARRPGRKPDFAVASATWLRVAAASAPRTGVRRVIRDGSCR